MKKFSKVFTLMGAVLALAFCLASCKTDEPTMYTVTVSSSIEHGKVTADKSSAEAGTTIKLTATADSGYELETLTVKDASSADVVTTEVPEGESYTFTMPQSDVTVNATFKKKVTLADIFLNGSVTTIKFNCFTGAQSATFENNDGTFSITSGAVIQPSGDINSLDPMDSDPGCPGLKTVTQDGNNLIIKYGIYESAHVDTTFTFNKEDNSYSITDSYFRVSDITALEVNGTDIKKTLTKK